MCVDQLTNDALYCGTPYNCTFEPLQAFNPIGYALFNKQLRYFFLSKALFLEFINSKFSKNFRPIFMKIYENLLKFSLFREEVIQTFHKMLCKDAWRKIFDNIESSFNQAELREQNAINL